MILKSVPAFDVHQDHRLLCPFLCYFQMSGRAGRRGFDPVGNVLFFGVPYRKVQRLITANIPKLVGNFPISVSLVLRLLLMTTKGDDKNDALTKVSVGNRT